MDRLTGIFRCLLPARYWGDTRDGAVLSIFVTAAVGVWIGLDGFLAYAGAVGSLSATVATAGGVSQRQLMSMGAISPLAFFFFTPQGWLADYLLLTAAFRGIALATDQPWGDPVLTLLDSAVTRRRDADERARVAREREAAEGPRVPDTILECRRFAGKEADFVVVSSRRKEGWTLLTTVRVGDIRLRVGEPREMTIDGFLRTCYPLAIIRDLQVDRRVVSYQWPKNAPPLEPDVSEDA